MILDEEMPEMTGTQALPELVRIVPPIVIVRWRAGSSSHAASVSAQC